MIENGIVFFDGFQRWDPLMEKLTLIPNLKWVLTICFNLVANITTCGPFGSFGRTQTSVDPIGLKPPDTSYYGSIYSFKQ